MTDDQVRQAQAIFWTPQAKANLAALNENIRASVIRAMESYKVKALELARTERCQ